MTSKNVRSLGLLEATSIGLGTMIAAGIFSLSGLAVSEIGSSAIISFVIAALIGGITAAAYSEFASIYAESGGGYLFASRTFENDYLIYIEGLMLFFGYSATTAFYLATMGEWVHEFIYPVDPWIPGVIVAILLGLLNARGTEESGTFQVVVSGLKVLVLFVFIGGAFAYQPPSETVSTLINSFSSDIFGIARISALAFITFFGFSAIAASAGEIKDPKTTVPLSIAISMISVTVLYALVIVSMVNSPVPAEIVAEQGETAMGVVAEAFIGEYGMFLIIAGAIFSMVSASNASILAASRIGYLMGKEGRMFDSFQYVSRKYGTPFWSVVACTGLTVSLIIIFIGIFPSHGQNPFGIKLGLDGLTGFANTNLLIPLSVVNVALILSRRKFKEIDRPFTVPLLPVIPIIGILANLSLLYNLPRIGLTVGIITILVCIVVYWFIGSDKKPIDDKIDNISKESSPFTDDANHRVLIPIARPVDVKPQLNLLDELYKNKEDVEAHIMYVEKKAEQLPTDPDNENENLNDMIEVIKNEVESFNPDTRVNVSGYVSISISEAILHTIKTNTVDSVIMGYPTEKHKVTNIIQHKSPCPVIFSSNFTENTDIDTVNVGVGDGSNHIKALDIIKSLPDSVNAHVTKINPEVTGTKENIEGTVKKLSEWSDITTHNKEARSVAKGLTEVSRDVDGVLFMGASRDNWLSQRLFGSTPDKVVELSTESNNIPVVIVSDREDITKKAGSFIFGIKRILWSIF